MFLFCFLIPLFMEFPNLKIVELDDSNRHLIDSFECDFSELSDFLKEDALLQAKQSVNKTYLWVSDKGLLLAYMTLCVDAILLSAAMRSKLSQKGISYKSLPALKIGRLAVRNGFTGIGIGRKTLFFAINIAIEINRHAACRFLTVDAKNYAGAKNPVGFYEKAGFVFTKDPKKGADSIPMYLDLLGTINASSKRN